MARLQTFLLLLAIPSFVQSITSTIRQQVVANKKRFQCTFTLKHTDTEVNTKTSKVSCFPKRPKKITANVELVLGNYSFVGKIRINPTRIISMTTTNFMITSLTITITTSTNSFTNYMSTTLASCSSTTLLTSSSTSSSTTTSMTTSSSPPPPSAN